MKLSEKTIIILILATMLICFLIVVNNIRPYQEWGVKITVSESRTAPFLSYVENDSGWRESYQGYYPILDSLQRGRGYWFYYHFEDHGEGKIRLLHRIEDEDFRTIWGTEEGYVRFPSTHPFYELYDWWVR